MQTIGDTLKRITPPKFIRNCLIITSTLGLSLVLAGQVVLRAQSSGWLVNIDAAPLAATICKVQGSGFSSSYISKTVRLRGVVYADFDQKSYGFYFQDEGCDTNSNTSDGIYAYLGGNFETVNGGDRVEVTGVIQEYYGKTEIRTSPQDVRVISSNNPLPTPVELSPPFDNNQAAYYFETHEDMYVSLSQSQVVGPTNSNKEAWVVPASMGLQRVFYDDPRGTGEVLCVDDRGLYKIDPQVRVGDQVSGLLGALDYSLGLYRLQLVASPTVIPLSDSADSNTRIARLPGWDQAGGMALRRPDAAWLSSQSLPVVTLATFNLANMFDTIDDLNKEDDVLSAAEYERRLKKRALAIHDGLNEPDILAVQEVENDQVLQTLVNQPEINASYGFVWQDTPDLRGLDIALLYQIERVVVIESGAHQGCTQLVDGFGPDGNGDKYNPVNAKTCDTDGDGVWDGNRLFSRPPLVVRLLVTPRLSLAPASATRDWLEIYVIVNHWKSRVEDSATVKYTLPRRTEQAQFVASLVQEIMKTSPCASVVVVGDLNDYSESPPLVVLAEAGLSDLSQQVERPRRYSYNYQGVSQVMDYVWARMALALPPYSVQYAAINSDFPDVYRGDSSSLHRSSDHDPLLVTFAHFSYFEYLPIVSYMGEVK